jgi:hypothetical protein
MHDIIIQVEKVTEVLLMLAQNPFGRPPVSFDFEVRRPVARTLQAVLRSRDTLKRRRTFGPL